MTTKRISNNKLQQATILSSCEHVPISLYRKLRNGKTLETESDIVDYAGNFVILEEGFFITILSIFDVDGQSSRL